jgi:predicted Rossmann fold flavoprotein
MKIGIIGGGPAGMMAAIEASKNHQDITIIDNNSSLGRKLGATGGGRGNLTNKSVVPELYKSSSNFHYKELILQYNYQFLYEYFISIGLVTYHTDDGWVYPVSNSAKNIAEFLSNRVEASGVKIINNLFVEEIKLIKNSFLLKTKSTEKFTFDKLIIATGGKAYPQLNSSDHMLNIVQKLGHHIISSQPALAPIETTKQATSLLNGVRFNATVSLLTNGQRKGVNFGNMIFTEWGVNGPAVMNLSHFFHAEQGNVELNIDCFSGLTKELLDVFQTQKHQLLYINLLPFFPSKLIDQLFKNSSLSKTISTKEFYQQFQHKLSSFFTINERVNAVRDFSFAQISTGSVRATETDPQTLQSKINPGIHFAGEILDVIGPCGGFNLHWAFVSGIVAGKYV